MKYSEEKYGQSTLPYLVFEPEENGIEIQTGKILIYLHGSGDRGKPASEVKDGWGLLRLLTKQIHFPFNVVAPICPENEIWEPDSIKGFIERLKIFQSKKLVLCGYSMGATGAYEFQAKHPGIVHGIISVAGRIISFSTQNMTLIPFWAVYGNEDERFTQSRIEHRIEEIQKLGGNAKLKVLYGKGHFISDEAFGMQEMLEWVEKL